MNTNRLAYAAAILIIFAIACGGGGDTAAPSPQPGGGASGATPGGTGTSVLGTAETQSGVTTDAATVLLAISEAMAEAGSWQVQAALTVRDTPGQVEPSLTTIIEAARSGPGANIVVTNSSVQSGEIAGTTSSENRVIAGVRYRRDPNSGEWTVSDASGAAPSLTVDAAVVEQMDALTATVIGTELDGEEVFHITGTVPGSDAAVTAEVFAGLQDRLVRMIRLEGTAPTSNFGGLLPDSDEMLPQSVEARYFDYGRAIVVHLPPELDDEEGAESRTYLSTINPFTMELPGGFRSTPRTLLTGESLSGAGGEAMFIVEEYVGPEIDVTGAFEGVGATVENYATRFEAVIALDETANYEIASNEPFTTESGIEARLVRFSHSNGEVQWLHLSYLHGEDVGFGASYGAPAERFAETEEAILAAFRSFDIVE
ncbi:MAG: hypothetical protein O3C10_01760 [Chloroflexi bacterium]|nr:hypothetical protein [Chloroflexota bacterium]